MANPFYCPLTVRRFFEFEPLVLKSSVQFQLNLVFIPLNIVEEFERVFYYVESFLKQTINSVWIFKTCPRGIKKRRELIYMLDDNDS